ncbi:MAG: D-aminoacyl-tRNA deacylase [Flavobacteriales bacterium]|jgi:D-aminoacyl-tRNA deacylase|nr:D-aminoacyl-tRNA deacylase [Flavobacteriales bacterium]
MRLVIQRVSKAAVYVDDNEVGRIKKGLLVFIGVERYDNDTDLTWLINKLVNMRIFPDETSKMNNSIVDVNGSVLLVSQFTLYASTKKGNRPSFVNSADPKIAKLFYNKFITALKELSVNVETGVFGANMQIELVNDGPVTICLDSKNKE